jgi:hypothetical protein
MVIVANVGVSRAAQIEAPSPCPNDGYISSRLVPNARVAESIYRTVASVLSPRAFKKYPVIVVTDEGDHWGVSQANNEPPPQSTPGAIVVTSGGGQLYMDIDKCTGAISHAAFNR